MEQATIFDLLYDKYVIRKPISLIEFFAGYGSQALALKYLGADYKSHKIVEWAVKSIEAYNDLHTKDYTNYSKDLSKEQLVEFLFNKGISMDYSQPMTLKQIKSKSEEWCRKVYNDIIATHNLVDISRVHATDLEMREGQENIITYSFPCQDLSLAGKGKGMGRESGTRSGLLWQVERILLECKEQGIMPNVLIMENVPEVKGNNNIEDFTAWVHQLERLGYSNYCDILNAKDFGIPQNRRRCFMVSILGEWNYKMPRTMRLKYKLKDFLEKNVAEKYFLSDKMIKGMINTNFNQYSIEKKVKDVEGIADTIVARFDGAPQCVEYLGTYQFAKSETFMKGKNRFQKQKEISDTLQTNTKEGVVIVGNYSPSKHNASRIVDTDELAPTVMENQGGENVGVVVKGKLKQELCNKLIENNMVEEGDVIRHSYSTNRMNKMYKQNQVEHDASPTLDTRCDCLGVVVPFGSYYTWQDNQGNINTQCNRAANEENYALTIACAETGKVLEKNTLRIRKLTPKECWRLMGVLDKDSELVKQSDNSKYHLAGDSIVTSVLMAIFGELLGIDYKSKIHELVEELCQQ